MKFPFETKLIWTGIAALVIAVALAVPALAQSEPDTGRSNYGSAANSETQPEASPGASHETQPEASEGAGHEMMHGVKHAYHRAASETKDAALDVRVKTALHEDKVTRDQGDIDVSSQDGVVTLTGKVPSRQVAKHAAEVVAQLHGVKDVDNALRYPESESE